MVQSYGSSGAPPSTGAGNSCAQIPCPPFCFTVPQFHPEGVDEGGGKHCFDFVIQARAEEAAGLVSCLCGRLMPTNACPTSEKTASA